MNYSVHRSLVRNFVSILSVVVVIVTACPEVVTRAEWGAKKPIEVTNLILPVSYMIVHHTSMSRCNTSEQCKQNMRDIQNLHMSPPRSWSDIGYQYLIGEDCRVYEGRGWKRVGAQALHWNFISVGIALMGDFMDVAPSSCALQTLREMIACGHSRGYLIDNYTIMGHRQSQRPGYTLCPGDQLLCKISKWQHWEPIQANGTFVLPKCLPEEAPKEKEILTNASNKVAYRTYSQKGSILGDGPPLGITAILLHHLKGKLV